MTPLANNMGSPAARADGASAEKPIPRRRVEPTESLLRHKRVARSIAAVFFVLAGPLAWKMGQPQYYTEAALQVAPRYTTVLEDTKEFELQSNSQYREFVQQQVKTITRYEILRDALKALGERRFLWQAPGESEQGAIERLGASLVIKPIPDTYLITVGLQGGQSGGLAEIINSVVASYLSQRKSEELYGKNVRVEALRRYRQHLEDSISTNVNGLNKLYKELGATAFEEMFSEDRTERLTNTKTPLKVRRAELLTQTAALANQHPAMQGLMTEISNLDSQIAQMTPPPPKSESAKLMREEIGRAQDRLTLVNNRLDFLSTESEAPGMVWLTSAARRPTGPQKSGRTKLFFIFVIVGLILSLAVPLVLDFLDPRIHSVQDLHRVAGFPPMGWTPADQGWPEFMKADQLRRLSLSIVRQKSHNEPFLLGFAAAIPGAGTSTLSLSIADDLHDLGVKVAVVDSNPFSPDSRYGNGEGVADSLGGRKKTLRPSAGKGAPRFPFGSPKTNAPISPLDGFHDFLQSLKANYDFVLIDAPALLTAPEAAQVVSECDGVLLVARAGGTLNAQLRAALQLLERIDPPGVGAVLNGMAVEQGQRELALPFTEHFTRERTRLSRILTAWLWS